LNSSYLNENTTEKYNFEVFTTKQPQILDRNNKNLIESSQINDDKELEFEKIDYNYLKSINVVQCGCPCKYGKINGLDTTLFYENECFDQWIGFIKGKYFKCFIENSCSTGIVYKGELRSNAFTSTTTPATPAPDFTSTSYLTTTTNNIEIEKIDFKYLKSINVKKCECFCYLGEIYGLANTPFYKNECRWKEFIQWKTFTCFIEKSCRTRIIYRGKLSSNTTTTTTVSSTTAATDFTSSSNTTSTITKIEIEKIDFRYLKSINVKLCGCMCYMGKAFDLSSTSFYKNQCFKGSKFLSWEYFFCFIKKSCQTENFIFYRGKLSSNSTSSASNTTSSNVVATSKPKIEKIDHNYLDSINVVQCGCSCKYGEFHRLANTSFYKNQCFDQWNGFIEWNSFSCFIEKTCSTGIIYRAKLSSNTNEVTSI
jgi:hypothetical protein